MFEKQVKKLIIVIEYDGKSILSPWSGCSDSRVKIDIYDQILYVWDEFVDYVISYKHKYQRTDYTAKFMK